MNEKRFVYYRMTQSIYDNLTGKRYSGDKKTCDLLNKMDDKINRNAEAYFEKDQLLKKVLKVNEDLQKDLE